MRSFRLAAFDLDGVLVDTTPCHAAAYAALWSRIGVDGPPYVAIAGRRTAEVVAEVAAPLRPGPEQIREWTRFKQKRARDYLATQTVIFPDTPAALHALHDNGMQLGLGTGASRQTATVLLDRLGAAPLFSVVVTADDVRAGKPHPEVYTTLMRRAGARPAETLVIEDSRAGVDAGLAADAFVASVRTGITRAGPAFVGAFPDLASLLASLEIDAR